MRGGEITRRRELLRPGREGGGGAGVGLDLGLERELGARGVREVAEEVARELVGLRHEGLQVGVEVLEAPRPARVQAPLDAEDDEDHDDEPDHRRNAAPRHDLAVALGGVSARGRCSARRVGWFVVAKGHVESARLRAPFVAEYYRWADRN
jgi:hypothetical protein